MRYFIGFLVTLGLIILVIFLLFRGGDNKPKVSVANKTLVSYATSEAQVSMTIDGPVNAESLHQQVRISIDRDNVTFQQLKGYGDDVIEAKRYDNSQAAFANFLISLERAGFTLGDNNPKLRDERGLCALGSRYIFELEQDGKQVERYWNTSCNKTKTYLGNFGLTTQLFKKQVPGYEKLVEDVDF